MTETAGPEPEAQREERAPGVPVGRGLPSVNALASLPQRMSRLMALGLVFSLGAGVLITYYHHALAHPVRAAAAADRTPAGEGSLPALPSVPEARSPEPPRYLIGNILGERAPELGPSGITAEEAVGTTPMPGSVPVDRRLSGEVFVGNGGTPPPPASQTTAKEVPQAGLSASFQTSSTPAVAARRLPTRRLLLPRGAVIDCTLQVAVDSSIPGLVTCLTATDTFGADGSVVLLERGTVLVGETRGEVRAGAARIGIVWTEARTPTGVVAALDSPATDALGRAGIDGTVDRHFWERFGAALVLTTIDAVLQAQLNRGSGTTVVYGNGATAVAEEVLKGTVGIPPTVRVAAGTRVQALVARDIDFRGVYALKGAP